MIRGVLAGALAVSIGFGAGVALTATHPAPASTVLVYREEDLTGAQWLEERRHLTIDHCGGDVCKVRSADSSVGWVLAVDVR